MLAYVSSHGVVTALSTTWKWPSGMGRIPASPGPQTNSKCAKEYEGFQKWKMCPTVCLFPASEGNVMAFVWSESSPVFPNLVQDAGRRQILIPRHILVPATPDPEGHHLSTTPKIQAEGNALKMQICSVTKLSKSVCIYIYCTIYKCHKISRDLSRICFFPSYTDNKYGFHPREIHKVAFT